jgi:site-specific DNA-methyltransferase (adenine-specific)
VRWWVRYLCPPGGLVLDPFYGSGTTGEAVVREGGGRRCVGVERVPEYAAAARERVAAALSKVG